MVGWNIRGFTPEKLSDPQFHEYLKAGSIGASRTVGAEPTLIACVEPKRGGDPVNFKNYKTFHSPRTERETDGAGNATVTCEDGGATLYVHERASGLTVRDHTSSLFPEVTAVEFDKALFSTSTNVVIVVAYISCSELPPAKKFVDTHHTTQLAALSELLCTFRMAGLQVLLYSDVNGYVLDFSGYGGGELEDWLQLAKSFVSPCSA